MVYRVVFRAEARDEAKEAVRYIIETGSPMVAREWSEGLFAAIASLAEFPLRCPHAREHDDFPGEDLRQLIYKSHRLIYTVVGDVVHVLHVRHAARANLEDLGH